MFVLGTVTSGGDSVMCKAINHRENGHTLLELLVGISISAALIASALVTTLANKRLVRMDATRTSLNQQLRSALNVISNDIRLAGEGLPADFPAIEVFPDGSPFRLVLRKRVYPWTFSLCEDLASSDRPSSVTVATNETWAAGTGCDYQTNSTQFQDVASFRSSWTGPNLSVFVYDPVSRRGDLVGFTSEQDLGSRRVLGISPASGGFRRSYAKNVARVLILEEWAYRVGANGHLEIVINQDDQLPLTVAHNIVSFEPRAVLRAAELDRYEASLAQYNWTDVNMVTVAIRGSSAGEGNLPAGSAFRSRNPFSRRPIERTVRGDFFPRNSLSARG